MFSAYLETEILGGGGGGGRHYRHLRPLQVRLRRLETQMTLLAGTRQVMDIREWRRKRKSVNTRMTWAMCPIGSRCQPLLAPELRIPWKESRRASSRAKLFQSAPRATGQTNLRAEYKACKPCLSREWTGKWQMSMPISHRRWSDAARASTRMQRQGGLAAQTGEY